MYRNRRPCADVWCAFRSGLRLSRNLRHGQGRSHVYSRGASCWALCSQTGSYGAFLLRLFIAALLVRMILGTAIFVFKGQDFFGGDAITYDTYGHAQALGWAGDQSSGAFAARFTRNPGSGWGMVYLVGAIYSILGRNMLAVQLVNSVIGAVTSVIIFLCAHQVFKNVRVARLAGIAVAFYPSLVLWSSQGLKDGPIMFVWRSRYWRR